MSKPNAANQQTQGSATGIKPQLFRDGVSPNGIVSGMTQRLRETDGHFVPPELTANTRKKRG